MNLYTEIESCRVSKEKDLVSFLNLGNQKLTGVFPDLMKKLIEVHWNWYGVHLVI